MMTRALSRYAEEIQMESEPFELGPDHEAEIVVLSPRNGRQTEPEPASHSVMNEDLAADWGLWSEQIGRALAPVLRTLAHSLPSFSSAMVCTADGFNLCTLGVDEDHVSRVSAMTSSMHSIAEAMSSSVHNGDSHLDQVSLTNGGATTVVLAVRDLITGPLLVWVTADDVPLGVLLMRARVAAEGIRVVLADD